MQLIVLGWKQREYVGRIFSMHKELAALEHLYIEQDLTDKGLLLRALSENHADAVLLVIRENWRLSMVLEELHRLPVGNIYAVRLFALNQKFDFLRDVQIDERHEIRFDERLVDKIPAADEKPYLVHLETHVCDHCNLNCKACNNFSPFVREPSYADPQQFERDVRRLAELFSEIGRFFLLGGEPLLAPELCCEMIRIYRRYFPHGELRVLTNATLILAMEDWFWDCLRENQVIIHISLYPPVFAHIDEIEARLREKEILYLIFKRVEKFAKRLTQYPFEDGAANNLTCGSGGCHYLRDGMMAKCPDAYLVGFLPGEEGSRLRSRDCQNIYEKGAWELIRRMNAPIDLCYYCARTRLEWVDWEPVGTEADPADWFTKHRFAYENDMLREELDKTKNGLDAAKDDLKIARGDARRWKSVADDLRRMAHETEMEYDRMQGSVSYRIGRGITWLPRKLRRFGRAAGRYGIRSAVRGTLEKGRGTEETGAGKAGK